MRVPRETKPLKKESNYLGEIVFKLYEIFKGVFEEFGEIAS